MSSEIDTPMLRFLIEHGKAGPLTARGTDGGFLLVMHSAQGDVTLRTQRGGPRLFPRIDILTKFVKRLGAREFAVQLDGWSSDD